jgi:hypothetical protein
MENRNSNSIPSPSRIREAFDYDPESGLLTWRIRTSNRAFPGREAGSPDGQGYRILMLDKCLLRTHRVAFAHYYGAWPKGFIDHINGDRSDNRICNLRDVSNAENLQNNWRPQKNNTTGFRGVWKDARRNKFHAEICVNKIRHRLGPYATAEEAHAAYLVAKDRLHVSRLKPSPSN